MSIAEISELVGLIGTLIAFIVSVIGWFKEKKWTKIKSFIEEKMIEAEKQELSGSNKLKYVLLACKEEYGKTFERLESSIRGYIEECINFSKKINHK